MTQAEGYRRIDPVEPARAPRIDELVWRRAAEAPQAPAIIDGSSTTTYGELVARAEDLAARLLAAGVGRGDPVAILLDRSARFVTAVVGVLRAGAACLLLSPADPTARTATLLAAVEPAVVITDDEQRDELERSGLRVLTVPAGAGPAGVAVTPPPADPSDLAFVMSTSGSAGTPKAVRISHADYTAQLGWIQHNLGLGAEDRVLVKAPTSFVSMLRQLIWPLAAGAALVIVAPGGEFDGPLMGRLIDEHRVSFLTFISPALGAFLQHADLDGASVRNVVTGGDRFPIGMAARFFEVFGSARLHHTYGMTETILVSCALLTGPGADELGMGPVLPGAYAFVLGPDRRPVAPGEVGELFVGGVGLTTGYLGRPDLDRERFVELPQLAAGRLFATRDRARLRADGTFELVGRSDTMVKVRGFRVELGEIEHALRSCPGVTHAVCRADTDAAADTRIVAFVQTELPEPRIDAVLRAQLRDKLPYYMIPNRFVRLAEIPLTANGKVDRARLPEVASLSRPETVATPGRRPGLELPEVVRAAWRTILKSDRAEEGTTSSRPAARR